MVFKRKLNKTDKIVDKIAFYKHFLVLMFIPLKLNWKLAILANIGNIFGENNVY